MLSRICGLLIVTAAIATTPVTAACDESVSTATQATTTAPSVPQPPVDVHRDCVQMRSRIGQLTMVDVNVVFASYGLFQGGSASIWELDPSPTCLAIIPKRCFPSSDGAYVALLNEDRKSVTVRTLPELRYVRRVSSDDEILLVYGITDGGKTIVWRTESAVVSVSVGDGGEVTSSVIYRCAAQELFPLPIPVGGVSASGRIVVFVDDGDIIVVERLTQRIMARHQLSTAFPCVTISADECRAIVAGPSFVVRSACMSMVNIAEPRESHDFGIEIGNQMNGVVSRSGKYAVSIYREGTARIWDAETGKLVETLELGVVHGEPTAVTFSRDDHSIIVGTSTGQIVVAAVSVR